MVLTMEETINGEEEHTTEEIVTELRQVDVVIAQGGRFPMRSAWRNGSYVFVGGRMSAVA